MAMNPEDFVSSLKPKGAKEILQELLHINVENKSLLGVLHEDAQELVKVWEKLSRLVPGREEDQLFQQANLVEDYKVEDFSKIRVLATDLAQLAQTLESLGDKPALTRASLTEHDRQALSQAYKTFSYLQNATYSQADNFFDASAPVITSLTTIRDLLTGTDPEEQIKELFQAHVTNRENSLKDSDGYEQAKHLALELCDSLGITVPGRIRGRS